jgi:phosphoglycolate phosphatase-like HAD superfamily hydrolase
MIKNSLAILTLVSFLVTGIVGPMPAYAQDYRLPAPGVMVHLSPEFNPPILKGIKVHPDNPFRFDFILDKGDSQLSNDALKDESSKLIKYFLASLTIPEKDLWVNLSPYEKDRIIPNSFGLTEMGRDLLAEDYMLKQITASLIYPEDEIGKKFWKRIYEEATKRYGTTNIPVNTFNKVWIVPEKAVVYENAKAGTAYVVESKLKVMLEQDYLSLARHEGILSTPQVKGTNQLGSQIVREIVIPELTTEVNENKNFAHLRQVYNSLILATWYKKKIKDSILEQVYADKKKVAGVNIDDPQETQRIYQRYLQAFKKGVYNYIKEDMDPVTQETVPRKYFSGGEELIHVPLQVTTDGAVIGSAEEQAPQYIEDVRLDQAMTGHESKEAKQLRAEAEVGSIDSAMIQFETQDDIVDAKQKLARARIAEKDIADYQFPDMVELINELGSQGTSLGLGSGNTNSTGILNALKVLPYFGTAIVDGNDVRENHVPGKPNKEFFIAVAIKMGKDPKNLVVIED